ncbi:MAG: tetratricopeptide repeat protein [Bacteroidales bacterium]|nr:tetratricopeptide repeat protein [Bacteroidales bacterium]
MKKSYLPLFIFLFGTAIYLNTLPNKYAYDDFSVIAGNRFTTEGLTGIFGHLFNDSFTGFTGQKNLFRGGRYRPLSLITFSAEYQFFGANPFISHFVNVILYGLICMLLFKVLAALFKEKLVFKKFRDYFLSLSLMGALIFAAHPIHTEVTANIKGRDELMALLFGLLAWNSIIRYADKPKPTYLFYGGLFLFLALMSKESAAPMLVLIPVSIYCFRSTAIFRKSAGITTVSLLAGFIIFMLIRQSVLGWSAKPSMEDNILSNSFMYASGFSERYGTTFYTLWLYLKLLFVPHPLTIDYYPFYIPYVGLTDVRAILPLLLYAGLTVAAIFLTYRRNIAGFGLLFYLGALFPVSNILFIIGPFMGERFTFIPSVGFAVAIAWILIRAAEKSKMTKLLPYGFAGLLLLYSGKTISRNFDWKDSFTLYTQDVKTSVNSAVITKGAGHELLLKAEMATSNAEKKMLAQRAIPYLEQAASMNKTTTETFLLGNAYYENGEYERALDMYIETLEINKSYEKAFNNYFVSVNRLNEPALKIKYYNLLIKAAGEKYETYYNKGLVFGKELNLPDSSISNLVRATMIDSTKLDCLSDLGVAYAMKGNFRQSAFYLEKALKINPADVKIRQNLSASYYNMGNMARVKELSEMR